MITPLYFHKKWVICCYLLLFDRFCEPNLQKNQFGPLF
jgi:hypothetical protein